MRLISFTKTIRTSEAVGLGTKIQNVIHAGLDITPMPAKTRQDIKECGGCKKRVTFINQAEAKFKDLLGISDQMQPPPAPPPVAGLPGGNIQHPES